MVVIGAGAAGLVAAIFAARDRQPVLVLERTRDGGRKILISGGGRCNVLPDALEPQRFVTDSPPQLVQRLLRSWPIKGQRAFFEEDVGLPLARDAETGKWFPASNRASDVRDGLVALAQRSGARLQFETEVTGLRRAERGWIVDTTRGSIDAGRVIVATGGLSVPSTGSTGTGLVVAGALGHVVHETYPALTPLVADPAVHARLAGVSLEVAIEAASARESARTRGGFLFTHRGYSGPAVLDVAHVAVRSVRAGDRASIRVRWTGLDEAGWHDRLVGSGGFVVNVLAERLPRRLAEHLVAAAGLPPDARAASLRRDQRASLVARLVRDELPWTGDEGYRKAEVTGGGVALDEVDPRTLESRRCPGMFFCGEVLDAFGPIGGHNFAWAWATGRLAGRGSRPA
ncbi:MAG: aminoacetone oxidase family FAD-binding enzyme [Acidobacteria bacterium]|nr:aminoacetone oxidase family FAD-binding enzyme [Acidobacteriota bacterium]